MILKINDRIRTRTIDFFNEFKLHLKFDSVASTFSVKFYFDPKNPAHAELACVSHFHEAWMEHNEERLITGYILSNVFNNSPKKELTEIGGYSKAGVLEDCQIPITMSPQFDGLTLKEIAERLIEPFKPKFKLIIDPSTTYATTQLRFPSATDPIVIDGEIKQMAEQIFGAIPVKSLNDKLSFKLDKANARDGQTIKSFLTLLAAQRNVLLSHDNYGNLLFTEAKTNLKPIAHFEGGVIGTSMALSFNGQGMHSDITVLSQNAEKQTTDSATIYNPYCPILYRPKVVSQQSGTDITVQETARQELSIELQNIKLTITTDRWEIDGKIIRPNNIISVLNPECFIYKKTIFFIESVEFTGDAKKTTAILNCVVPEVYNKETPKNIFVDPHRNLPRL